MSYEQLSFSSQQLAGMLRSGLPLEGALRQLCTDMESGRFREELQALQLDLSRGVPLAEAVGRRRLPAFYVRMLQLGARGNDLPGVLILMGDYYQRAQLSWTRLTGLMVYPAVVLLASVVLIGLLAGVLQLLLGEGSTVWGTLFEGRALPAGLAHLTWRLWMPTITLGLVLAAVVVALAVPSLRSRLRWRLPGFRDGSLANLASVLHLMLAKGCPLGEALAFARELEGDSIAADELKGWGQRLADGQARLSEFAAPSRVFPPLFVWVVAQAGEDLAAGFRRAAELYHQRAVYRIELWLYLALPVSVVLLGALIVTAILPVAQVLTMGLDMLGSVE
jgi:general secretion pathway protein F